MKCMLLIIVVAASLFSTCFCATCDVVLEDYKMHIGMPAIGYLEIPSDRVEDSMITNRINVLEGGMRYSVQTPSGEKKEISAADYGITTSWVARRIFTLESAISIRIPIYLHIVDRQFIFNETGDYHVSVFVQLNDDGPEYQGNFIVKVDEKLEGYDQWAECWLPRFGILAQAYGMVYTASHMREAMPAIANEYDSLLDLVELYNYETSYTSRLIRDLYFKTDKYECAGRNKNIMQHMNAVYHDMKASCLLWASIKEKHEVVCSGKTVEQGYVWIME